MLKVFLAEDEGVIWGGFRDKIPWEQYEFKLAGKASSGEMALPLIRKIKSDVLLTDVKIPFIDELSLNETVKEEFPKMEIIIISGYDGSEYTRQAITAGADRYLLKPITRTILRSALLEIKEKIEQESKQKDYQARYQDEMQEFERFVLRRFFEKILGGKLSVKEIYEEAAQKSIPLTASCYNPLLFSIYEKHESPTRKSEKRFMRKQEKMSHYFLRHSQYILFRLDMNCYGVLTRGESSQMELPAESSLTHMKQVCDPKEADTSWHVAVGMPMGRLSLLPQCYEKANHYLAYHFIMPSQHILAEATPADCLGGQEEEKLEKVNFMRMDPEIIQDPLTRGGDKEIHGFVKSYLQNVSNALKSRMFRSYVILNIRFAVVVFLESLGTDQEDYQDDIEETVRMIHQDSSQVFEHSVLMLWTAAEIRDRENSYQGGKMLKKALGCIDENYGSGALSLNPMVEHVGISTSYLSAIFSQTMQRTFVEYVTEKQTERARKLLKQADRSSSEITREVGYKDAHCFSLVFRK